MLKALKNQLKTMADSPDDPFHRLVRKRVGKKATQLIEERLKMLILGMPKMIERVYKIWETEDLPSSVKRLNGFLLTYLYHPKDFLPEDGSQGLFGYLDDAYMTALIYEQTLEHLAQEGRLKGEDFLWKENLGKVCKAVVCVIPDEAKKITSMIQEIRDGKTEKFSLLFAA